MQNFTLYTLIFLVVFSSCSDDKSDSSELSTFNLNQIKLTEGPFYNAQEADLKYMLKLDPDRLLAPFLVDAGLEPLKTGYGNWEGTGLNGHIGGHYLSALAMMYSATGNEELLNRLNYMLEWLDKCQKANGNGYVGGIPDGKQIWKEIAEGNILAENFSLNDKWVPLYNIHKTYAGLRDAYLFTDSEVALNMWIGLADWWISTTSNLTDDQFQEMLVSEHGGLNEVFADLYKVTENEDYLAMAEKLSHRAILDPLLAGQDKLTGLHANTQIPKVIGFEKIAALSDSTPLLNAVDFFWENVVNNRTVAFGGNSVKEHFNPIDDFSEMISSEQGPETCNTYNMLKLSRELFLETEDIKYLEYYERALFNHILSSQHPEGGFVYFTPIRPHHYRVYSTPENSMWCCVGSGMENHAKYGDLIYSKKGSEIWVNLYISSELDLPEYKAKLIQESDLWNEQQTGIRIELKKPEKMDLKFRIPHWIEEGSFQLKIDGKPHDYELDGQYARVNRIWYNRDQVILEFKTKIQQEQLPDKSNWYAFVYGPFVLAAETSHQDLDGLEADDGRMSHVASGKPYPKFETPIINVKPDFEQPVLVRDGNQGFEFNVPVHPKVYRDLNFKPFYQVHDARYVMYLPMMDSAQLETWISEND